MRPIVFATLVLLAGCLGPRADTSAFFMLSSPPAPANLATVSLTLGIGPVTLPGYLDRSEIIERVSDHQIRLSPTDRWAEPLEDNVASVLAADLTKLLPGSSTVGYPWYESDAPDVAVAVDIRKFETDPTGSAVLDATWTLTVDGTTGDTRSTVIEQAAEGLDRASAVAAQSRALRRLAEDIAQAVRGR